MAHPFEIEVVAADHKVYSGQAVSLVVPSVDGYLGILSGHAPLVAALTVGELTITLPDGTPVEIALGGGFIRVDHDRVTILADTAELAKEIDLDRAQRALARAEARVHEPSTDIDVDRARMALLRAINRLRVAQRGL
jgi:F-type H+-transporting ATPase subunit epsilon